MVTGRPSRAIFGLARRRGVMLVDAIVGTVLLGVALAVLIGLAGRAMSAQSQGEQLQTGAMLLDERLNLVLLHGPDEYGKRFELTGACEPPFEAYRYEVEIAGGQSGDPYVVTATIFWRAGGGGRERSATIQTLIAPRLGDEPDPIRKPEESVRRDL